ncbi:hypothetical protein SAY86_030093 [Trapa natans]|uniref:MYB transcription factor n=1 Tax=Trapa natans TaxID=22666 RepID=A0AAN7MFH7_TRANT|nr:hypothetical protein SAY86_030093 [Trapa natans]
MRMGRKCSHCGNVGHNSRTCTTQNPNRRGGEGGGGKVGLKLFGVQIGVNYLSANLPPSSSSCPLSSSTSSSLSSSYPDIRMKKSFSMDCFSSNSWTPVPSSPLSTSPMIGDDKSATGYNSDGLVRRSQEMRKKAIPWTEEEHRLFLLGLERLGRGDWRGISRYFVKTRTPTQVASHAQKYFLRHGAAVSNRRCRFSLFDNGPVGMANENDDNSDSIAVRCPNSGGNDLELRLAVPSSIIISSSSIISSQLGQPTLGYIGPVSS